jgi:hypothetical protein
MPLIKAPLADDFESQPVPEGAYDLRIEKAEDKESKAGNPMTEIMIVIEDTEHPNASPIFYYLNYPPKDHEYYNLMWQQNKRFLAIFGVPFDGDGFNTDDLAGATGNCMLDLIMSTYEDVEEERNELRLPRVQASG